LVFGVFFLRDSKPGTPPKNCDTPRPVCKIHTVVRFVNKKTGKVYTYPTGYYRGKKKTKGQVRQQNIRYRMRVREFIRELKSKPCQDCGIRYPYYVMDFDHVRGEKLFNVSEAASKKTITKVAEEIAKCDLVCANCHRLRTHMRSRMAH
jgi:hypothetical protein